MLGGRGETLRLRGEGDRDLQGLPAPPLETVRVPAADLSPLRSCADEGSATQSVFSASGLMDVPFSESVAALVVAGVSSELLLTSSDFLDFSWLPFGEL